METVSPNPMYCPQCGTLRAADAKFCAGCGTQFDEVMNDRPEPEQETAEENQETETLENSDASSSESESLPAEDDVADEEIMEDVESNNQEMPIPAENDVADAPVSEDIQETSIETVAEPNDSSDSAEEAQVPEESLPEGPESEYKEVTETGNYLEMLKSTKGIAVASGIVLTLLIALLLPTLSSMVGVDAKDANIDSIELDVGNVAAFDVRGVGTTNGGNDVVAVFRHNIDYDAMNDAIGKFDFSYEVAPSGQYGSAAGPGFTCTTETMSGCRLVIVPLSGFEDDCWIPSYSPAHHWWDGDGDGTEDVFDEYPNDYDNDGISDDWDTEDNTPTWGDPVDVTGQLHSYRQYENACNYGSPFSEDGNGEWWSYDTFALVENNHNYISRPMYVSDVISITFNLGGESHSVDFEPNLLDYDNDGISDYIDSCPEDWANDCLDYDRDGISDDDDNCQYVSNNDQSDYDSDGEGDVCDSDDDGDGIPDGDDFVELGDGGIRIYVSRLTALDDDYDEDTLEGNDYDGYEAPDFQYHLRVDWDCDDNYEEEYNMRDEGVLYRNRLDLQLTGPNRHLFESDLNDDASEVCFAMSVYDYDDENGWSYILDTRDTAGHSSRWTISIGQNSNLKNSDCGCHTVSSTGDGGDGYPRATYEITIESYTL